MNFVIVLTVILALSGLGQAKAACGYKSCNPTKANMINVHLVPHSHDDVGWLKTVSQYFFGARNNIQRAGVQYIIDSVIAELLKNPSRRFIQVETFFFYKWYNRQPLNVRKSVKMLVDSGRLEFIGGAWSMNDEAAVHYQSVVDQFTIGIKYLSDNFGACGRPRVGWQIDPFGHSREMASMFAQMGFDGQFFARMDWVEKGTRLRNLSAEMIWKASENLGESSDLFTGLLFNHYSAPSGFCFDNLCSDQPIIDDDSYENNVDDRVTKFTAYIENMAKYYRTSHLQVPMGDDFNYESAHMNFKNMDKLIKYVNERQSKGSKVNLLYSTPSCYLKALHESKQFTWPTKTEDFFPYSTDNHTYWSGYFSSRPTQKRFERDGNHFLQITKQLTTLANFTSQEMSKNLNKLSHIMGIMQHHDAITGTEKQHVANDYNRLLTEGFEAAKINIRLSLQKLTNFPSGEFVSCMQLNISSCEFTQKSAHNLVVTVFNPLSQPTTHYIRIPVQNGTYVVTDASGKEVRHQIVPIPKEVAALTDLRGNYSTQHELVIETNVIKLENFHVNIKPQPKYDAVSKEVRPNAAGNTVVQNSLVKLTFNNKGILNNIQMNGISENVEQQFYYYRGALGNNSKFEYRSSGAYIFRPNGSEILVSPSATIRIFEGPLVKEIHQHFNPWVSQIIRIFEKKNIVEFEWLVGPLPITDKTGKEVITRFNTNLVSKGVFYTDSNGREMLRRGRNQREGFKPNLNETVSSNYYPVTARITLRDETSLKSLTLLNDRAQGGSSLKDGQLELMLHRRLLHDDAFGVGEALNETSNGKEGVIARGKIHFILNSIAKPSTQERFAAKELHLPPYPFFSTATKATNRKLAKLPDFTVLPKGIELLTLESFNPTERLIRLEHILDKTESTSISFNLKSLFDALGGQEIRETTLDGNMNLSEMKRMKFQADDKAVGKQPEYITAEHPPLHAKKTDGFYKFAITMKPMQIRSFIVKWKL